VTRQQKATAGAAAIVVGAWLLHQAYEGAGRSRPFALRFLPG
jgi:uncharacterized protein YfaA (DUF2138 family)